jgi:uncharacterized protein YceH (UPF0502 family)
MELTAEEARVLASLMEKDATVPDSYPLTLNSLRLACNQTSSRDPIVAYDDRTVDAALVSLKSKGLVRFVHASHGGRTTRYRHAADERWAFDRPELAVLSVLVLRGPQTAGELRTRAARQQPFGDVSEVEEVLDTLAARTPDPFVVRLAPRPGQKDARWAHLLSGTPADDDTFAPTPWAAHRPEADMFDEEPRAAADLTARVEALEARLSRLEEALGIPDDEADTNA